MLTAKGFYLVEIKSHPCTFTGDNGTWTLAWPDGRKSSMDNPRLATDKKAKRLKSLLERQRALRDFRLPYLQEVVFLSAETAQIQLDLNARHHIYTRDRSTPDGEPRPGILAALKDLTDQDRNQPRRARINQPLANAISRAMEQAGIRPSTRQRRFGAYELKELLLEGPGYQDWRARHTSLDKVERRVRIYPIAPDTEVSTRQMLNRAAKREFTVLQGIHHQGILPAVDYAEGDQGPGLIFDFDPAARRLDHFLREEGERLGLFERIDLLRQVAEAVRYAHDKRLVHRAISPLSVLVRGSAKGRATAQLYNWQAASRDAATTTGATSGTLTLHVDQLVEDAAQVYLAPETLRDPSERAEHLDVFGLGALAYLLFANKPPAEDHNQLRERLARERGLMLSSDVDGASPELVELIRSSTHPDVTTRLASVGDFLAMLDLFEEALTRPEVEVVDNPTEATVGQRFRDGNVNYVVKQRLGKGSSAVVFLLEKQAAELVAAAPGDAKPEQVVLKLALDPDKNPALEAEAKALEELHKSPHKAPIVRCRGRLDLGGHTGLLLDKAGNETLADRLRKQGPIELELLQRFGDDLLSALQFLEEHGVFHRDLKPDNIGVGPVGRGDSLHLVLFDFSLANASATQIQAGTRAYLDPFLGTQKRRQYDPAAERYAAAVTLYEMATGGLPRWGDGKSDPASVPDIALHLDVDAFDPALRQPLAEFFEKALARDYAERFDNAEEMKRRWGALFAEAERPALPAEQSSDITLDTPLRLVGLSNRAVNALERDAIETVRALLELPFNQITHRRGVGSKTRQELVQKVAELRAKFPDVQPAAAKARKGRRAPQPTETEVSDDLSADEAGTIQLDALAARLVPNQRGRSAVERRTPKVLTCLLGAIDKQKADGSRLPDDPWPTQTAVGKQARLTTVQVHQVLQQARERWRRLPDLTRFRDEVVELLRGQGGIVLLGEAVQLVARTYGQDLPVEARDSVSLQVLRAAWEVETSREDRRFEALRRQDQVWLVAPVGSDGQEVEPAALVGYSLELGRRARRLADLDPLPSSQRVLDELRQVAEPGGLPSCGAERLVRLAAAAGGVAASVRLELYPVGMDAERALRLAQGALLGAAQLTTQQLRDRVAARFPDAAPLPGDVAPLQRLLASVLPDLRWDGAMQVWRFHVERSSSLAGDQTLQPTVSTWSRPLPDSPEVEEARLFDERLVRAKAPGSFLVLAVPRQNHEAALARVVARFEPAVVSVEHVFLQRLREEADKVGVRWQKVLAADAAERGSADWKNLVLLAQRAAAGLADVVDPGDRPALVTRLGMLHRYGLLTAFVERLRERSMRRPDAEGALHAAWLLIATHGDGGRPMLDGEPVPVIDNTGWADVPRAWIQGAHREQAS